MKPLSSGFKRALALVEGSVEDSVMVGDQLFTDVVGAHLIGMPAYLVAPLVDVDLKHTQLAVSYTHLDVYKRQLLFCSCQ